MVNSDKVFEKGEASRVVSSREEDLLHISNKKIKEIERDLPMEVEVNRRRFG